MSQGQQLAGFVTSLIRNPQIQQSVLDAFNRFINIPFSYTGPNGVQVNTSLRELLQVPQVQARLSRVLPQFSMERVADYLHRTNGLQRNEAAAITAAPQLRRTLLPRSPSVMSFIDPIGRQRHYPISDPVSHPVFGADDAYRRGYSDGYQRGYSNAYR